MNGIDETVLKDRSAPYQLEDWVQNNVQIPDGEGGRRSTDALGQISFKGATRTSLAEFIRVGVDTEAATIYQLLVDGWQLEQPSLLVSVTGGAKNFSLDPELEQNFQSGLVKVAKIAGAWILTGGTNTGVMQHVGEALHGITNSLIGVSPWGAIRNKESLNSGKLGSEAEYPVACSLTQKGAFLDHYHTQHILVDDGSERFGSEIPFRSRLEEHFLKQEIPAVLLVMEGGFGTLKTVHESLTKQSPIPVVVVEGSGRVANILSLLHRDPEYILEDAVFQFLPDVTDRPEVYEAVCKQIKECLEQKDFMTIFSMTDEKGVDEAILLGLLKCKMYNKELDEMQTLSKFKQLQFLLLWGRGDLAKSYFSRSKDDWHGKEKELGSLFLMALALNRVDSVKLFISYGVNVQALLTPEALEFLYAFCAQSEDSLLSVELAEKTTLCQYRSVRGNYVEVMRTLCRFQQVDSAKCCIGLHKIENILQDILSEFLTIKSKDFKIINVLSGTTEFKYPFKELYFFALLNNMHEMALYFWSFEEECLAKGFFGIEINRHFSNISESEDLPLSITSQLNENTQVFKDLCVNLLDECYSRNRGSTETLLRAHSEIFHPHTCLSLAIHAQHEEFISHNAVQVLLNDIWSGDMKETTISRGKLFLGILFFPYIGRLTFHHKSRVEEEHDHLMKEVFNAAVATVGVEEPLETSTRARLISQPQRNYKTLATHECSKKTSRQLPFIKKLTGFYSAPVVKFLTNLMAYIAFLLLFAYVTMSVKNPSLHVSEWILVFFVVSLGIEEIRQIIQDEGLSMRNRAHTWWSSDWNKLDLIALLTFFTAFAFRLREDTLPLAQPVFAVNAMMWYIRLLNVFFADKTLGPYVVMIFQMFQDMLSFLIVLSVFLVAYGVSSASLLAPQSHVGKMFEKVFFHPYFNIYGELFIDRDPEDDSTTRFGTPVLNSYSEPLAWILLGFYLLVANVLLLNLLIAIFNNTYTKVQENTDKIWKFKRYDMIKEYSRRPVLVPPFILLCHVYMIGKYIFSRRCQTDQKTTLFLSKNLSYAQKNGVDDFENECKSNLLRKQS